MIRIVICVDLPGDSPVEAYRTLYQLMGSLPDANVDGTVGPAIDGWESTDEWFADDGEPMTAEAVQEARSIALELENP